MARFRTYFFVVAAVVAASLSSAREPNAGIYGVWVNKDALLDQPYMAGTQVVVQWRDVEPNAEGSYVWTKMDNDMASFVGRGLSVTIQINGNRKPDWLFDVCPYNPDVWSDQVSDSGTLMYWHPTHKRAYLNMIAAFAAHLRASALRTHVVGVRMNYNCIGTEPTNIPANRQDQADGWIKPPGCPDWGQWPWTGAIGSNYVTDVMTTYEAEFKKEPRMRVMCRTGSHDKLLTLFPTSFNAGDLGWFTTAAEGSPREDWCNTQYGMFQNDCLTGETLGYTESWGDSWGHHNGLSEDYYTITDAIKYRMSPPQENYWRILWDLSVGVSCIAVYGRDLEIAYTGFFPTNLALEPSPFPYRTGDCSAYYKDDFLAAFQFGAKYAGYHADPAGSPGAWIAFRYGQYNTTSDGDFKFHLSRVTPDNTTYPQPYGTTVGSFDDRFGAHARFLPASQSMNLVLNSAFLTSLSAQEAVITTTYLDEGTGTLAVIAGGETFSATLGNTGQWKTLAGTVSGAALTPNGQGGHIRLNATGQQVTLHMVEVTRAAPPSQLPASFTRKSMWNNADTGERLNSGCNANDNGVLGSVWRYDYVNGGALGSADPWYAKAGTPLLWDSTNTDWDSGAFWPQIDEVGPAHTGVNATDYAKVGRVILRAPQSGSVSLSGFLDFAFFIDPSAKTTEWAFAKTYGASYTVLASGQQSINASEAATAMVTKTLTITPAAFPALQNIHLNAGEELIWTHRLTAQGGSNGVRMKDERLTLQFQADGNPSTAVRQWQGYLD